MTTTPLRHDWNPSEVQRFFTMPFADLLFDAQTVHRQYFKPNQIQATTLLSIKTGGCPEDCHYCNQSAHHTTGLDREKLLSVDEVVDAAKAAKANGATRFCMGGAWRAPREKEFPLLEEMVQKVKDLGLETCMTLGMLTDNQAKRLSTAGLDYYNHNLDTSPEYYKDIITTRTYQDRLDTLENVRNAGMEVCCGGIVGMGESREDRIGLLRQLANLPEHPKSVPINRLVPIPGTPLQHAHPIENFDFIRTIAAARIMMPQSIVRLAAGRETMNEEMQALCFLAGANSIFYGEKLLTEPNNEIGDDVSLLEKLGITTQQHVETVNEQTALET